MPHRHYTSVMDEGTFGQMLHHIKRFPVSALDIETTSLSPWEGTITSLSMTFLTPDNDEPTFVIPLDHIDSPWGYMWRERLQYILRKMKRSRAKFIPHNADFELLWLWVHSHMDPTEMLLLDTQVVAHILNENQSMRLKNLADHLMDGDWSIDVRDTRNTPWFDLAAYNANDTIATLRLAREQGSALRGHDDLVALNREMVRVQRALVAARWRGMRLDVTASEEAPSGARGCCGQA